MKRMLFMLLAITGMVYSLAAQSRILKEEGEVITAANEWLKSFLMEEDTRELLGEFKSIKGFQTWDIVVAAKGSSAKVSYGKGRIQTIFLVESDIQDHNFNGRFKDLLRSKEFDWKMRKGEQVKVRFTFEI